MPKNGPRAALTGHAGITSPGGFLVLSKIVCLLERHTVPKSVSIVEKRFPTINFTTIIITKLYEGKKAGNRRHNTGRNRKILV
jgi:hypothetical protein